MLYDNIWINKLLFISKMEYYSKEKKWITATPKNTEEFHNTMLINRRYI